MRSIAKLMKDWQFTGPNGVTTAVELPHTWNAKDGQDGGNDYWRGCCTYCTGTAAGVAAVRGCQRQRRRAAERSAALHP